MIAGQNLPVWYTISNHRPLIQLPDYPGQILSAPDLWFLLLLFREQQPEREILETRNPLAPEDSLSFSILYCTVREGRAHIIFGICRYLIMNNYCQLLLFRCTYFLVFLVTPEPKINESIFRAPKNKYCNHEEKWAMGIGEKSPRPQPFVIPIFEFFANFKLLESSLPPFYKYEKAQMRKTLYLCKSGQATFF